MNDLSRAIIDRARNVSHALGIREPHHGAEPQQVRALEIQLKRLISDWQRDPTRPLDVWRRLRQATDQIDSQLRALGTCLTLIEELYRVPMDSPIEAEIARLLKEFYYSPDTPQTHAQIIGRSLSQAQWSSFPVVRRVACRVRAFEKVGRDEVRLLSDKLAANDVRLAVAKRIAAKQQIEYLEELLDYLFSVKVDPNATAQEVSEAGDVLDHDLPLFPFGKLAPSLLRRYADHFGRDARHDPTRHETRGWIMKALASLGDTLADYLKKVLETPRLLKDYPPEAVLRLLRHMVMSRTNLRASEILIDAMLRGSQEIRSLASSVFEEIAREFAQRSNDDQIDPVRAIRTRLQSLIPQLKTQPYPELVLLGARLEGLEWQGEISSELLERIVAGKLNSTDSGWDTARRGGRRVIAFCESVLADASRTNEEKIHALQFMPKIYALGGEPAFRRLCELYLRPQADSRLRLEALAVLGFMAERSNRVLLAETQKEEVRVAIFNHYYAEQGAEARVIILDAHRSLFPDSPAPRFTRSSEHNSD